MSASEDSSDIFNKLWKFFASVHLTVVVLIALAASSVIGTLIPQNEDPAEYAERFGRFWFTIFDFLNIFDMYHSGWFRFMRLLLGINIVVCSVERLSSTWKILFPKVPNFNLAQFKAHPGQEFKVDNNPRNLKDKYLSLISKYFGYVRAEDTDKGFCIFAEKGRWTRLGVYVVHLSVLMLLVGGMIGSIFGFEGFVNIAEGDKTDVVRLKKSNRPHHIPFEIRCDKFSVSFYETGAPKEFRSALTLLENGKTVMQKDIIVNHPLRYNGVNIFQASYGSVPSDNVTLSFTSKSSGMSYTRKAKVGESVEIPEGLGSFVLNHFHNSYEFMGHNMGETFVGTLTMPDGKKIEDVQIPLRFKGFDKMRRGDVIVDIAGYEPRYFTGLQVTEDPGVWVVYSGFILMIIGCFITFFMVHQRLCIEVSAAGEASRVSVFGTSNKNKIGMERRVGIIAQTLTGLDTAT